MGKATVIKRGTIWFSMLAISVASISFLWADDGRPLSKQEVKTLIGSASTVQDHQRLANHFDAKADELEAESKEHQELAAKYRANPTIMSQNIR